MKNVYQLENVIQSYIDNRSVLGLSLAIVDGDEVVYARGFGLADAEEGRAATTGTLFDVGSIAKTVLATLILRLVEAGRLDLDVPVMDYLPGFTFSDSDLGRAVTLRHLLSHTSGLPSAGKDWGPPERDALERFAHEQLSRYAFVAEPGRIHRYSNTAVTLAGYVAEVVTGRSYRDLVRELVCQPLGMDRTTYDRAVAMTYPLALPHEEVDGKLRVRHHWTDNRSGDPSSFLITGALDLANLAIALANGGKFGGQQFLSLESVAEMQTPVATIPRIGARHPFAHLHRGYGLGLWTGVYRGERVVRHGGVSQSFNSYLELLPDRRRGFVALSNWSQGGGLLELILQIYNVLLDQPNAGVVFVETPPPFLDESRRRDWRRHEGSYLDVSNGRVVAVRIRGQDLTLEDGEGSYPLTALTEHDYIVEKSVDERSTLSFLPRMDGPTDDLYLAAQPYRRVAIDSEFVPDPSTWPSVSGVYRDPSNLDPESDVRIRCADGKLFLGGYGEEEACQPFGPNAFLSSWGLLEFVTDGSSVILVVGGATRYERVGESIVD